MGNVPLVFTKSHKKSVEKQWEEHEKTNWNGLKWAAVDSTIVRKWMLTEKMIVILTKNQEMKKQHAK
jgi:hypothetical protein